MHIQGTCDLFTTKPVGADRKLYKVLGKLYNSNEDDPIDMKVELNDNTTGVSDSTLTKQKRQNSSSSIHSNNSTKSLDSLNSQFIQLKNRSFSYSYSRPISILSEDKVKRSHSFTSPSPEPDIDRSQIESPFGPLSQSSSIKLFGYLIGALNATYPDHDFSTVQPNHFTLLSSASDLVAKVNSFLISSGKSTGLDWIWQTINTHIDLEQCMCFQFEPQQSFVDDLSGVIWCNMYFMFNKKKKRVAFLYFLATILNETGNNSGIMRRRNSKIDTLDEEGMRPGEEDSEYDLRYNNDYGPIYEDVFEDDDDINMGDERTNTRESNTNEAGEYQYDDYDEADYAMSDEEFANENQDDEGFV